MGTSPSYIDPVVVGTITFQRSVSIKAGSSGLVAGLVVATGWDGQHPICDQADAGTAALTNSILYWANASIPAGEYGVVYEGAAVTMNTGGSTIGNPIYVGSAGALSLTAGATSRVVGRVLKVDATSGVSVISVGRGA